MAQLLRPGLLWLCLLGWPLLLVSQPKSLEQIEQELTSAPETVIKVDLLIEASRLAGSSRPDRALTYAQEALALSRKIRSREGVVNSQSNLGLVLMNLDRYQEAVPPLKTAADLKKELLSDKPALYSLSIARDYQRLGICYEKLRDNETALDYYQRQATYASKARSYEVYAQAKNSAGEVQLKLGDYQEAYQSFTQALKYAQRSGSKSLVLSVEKNLAQTQTLTRNSEAAQQELQSFQFQLEEITDSLDRVEESRQTLISEKELLELERDKKEAEIRAREAQLMAIDQELAAQKAREEALQSELAATEARQLTYLIGAGGAALILFLIILFLVSRARARKKANLALAVEKRKSDDLLLNILPEKVAEELKTSGKVQSVRYEDASILFTDFQGFTTVAADMAPEELIAMLEELFAAFDRITEKYGLEKIKTIGDAYMAVAGLPHPDHNHAIHAVAAAMEMQEYMDQWIGRQHRRNQPIWQLRIGINSGPVVAGVIGKKKFAYDIWGDAVNVASRIESACEAGKVNISAATYERVRYFCDCEPKRTAPLKNKGLMDMYHVREILKIPAVNPVEEEAEEEVSTR